MFIHIFIVMDKQCSKCGVIKNINDFYKSQRGSKCKECILEITREYKRNKRKNSEFRKNEGKKQKERRVRLWQNTLLNDSNRKNIIREIDVNFINELYEKQNGLCYWFKVPLIPSNSKKKPQQPSLDRLDRNKGYTKDNVVLTCYAANIGRNENDVKTWSEFLNVLFQKN